MKEITTIISTQEFYFAYFLLPLFYHYYQVIERINNMAVAVLVVVVSNKYSKAGPQRGGRAECSG